MEFKHYATDEIIEIAITQLDGREVGYCKELDKHFLVIREKGKKAQLKGTSYFEK